MTACNCPACDISRAIWANPQPTRRPYNAADYATEDELRRSRGGLSRGARREQRRPVPLRVDEQGYDKRGRYYAAEDGAA